MARKHSLRIITDDSQAPEGYVRVSSLGLNGTDVAYISVHAGIDVPAVKLMRTTTDIVGPLFVDPIAARALLARRDAKKDALANPPLHIPAAAESEVTLLLRNMATTLTAIHTKVDRIYSEWVGKRE